MRDRSGSAFYGMGDARPITNIVGSSLLTTGGVVAMFPGGQIPGAIIAAVGAATTLIGSLFKPDLTKIQATHIVDQIESQVLKPILQYWESLPAEQKTSELRDSLVATVDDALARVQQGCSNPALEEAGQRCISERLVRGGTAPWCPSGSGCDWISLYRDPIANDPEVRLTVGGIDIAALIPSGPGIGQWLPIALMAGLVYLAVEA